METRNSSSNRPTNASSTPHSLGKLIEWKLVVDEFSNFSTLTPHSLGKLIEWKPEYLNWHPYAFGFPELPTRWGN